METRPVGLPINLTGLVDVSILPNRSNRPIGRNFHKIFLPPSVGSEFVDGDPTPQDPSRQGQEGTP